MKTIPLFISSTFNDMNLERDVMREHVLPALKEKYNNLGVEILLFDLRWGIFTGNESTEKQKEKEILRSCFQIIDMCRPFFIAFLGDRLGWVPEEDVIENLSIADVDTKKTLKSLNALSVTHLEIEYGVLNRKNFSQSLVFYRDKESYEGLSSDRLSSYIESDPEKMSVLDNRKRIIRKLYTDSGNSGNIVDYKINLSNPSGSDIYGLSQIICSNLVKIIDREISNSPSDDIFSRDEIYLANYQESQAFVDEICNEAGKNDHILIYGDEGYGKTSLSLILKNKLLPRFKTLYYSSDYTGPQKAQKIIKSWTEAITGRLDLQDLDSLEKEWSRFLYLLTQSDLEKVVAIIDGFDKLKEFTDSNIFFLPRSMMRKIQFIVISKNRLPKWEQRFGIPYKRIKGLTRSEALRYIGKTCYNNGKSLPQDVVNELLGKYGEENIPPVELSVMLNYVIMLDSTDFERISSLQSESNEEKIHRYLLDSVRNMPSSYAGKIDYIINRVILKYGHNCLIPFKYIVLSLNGLSTDDLYELDIPGFDFVLFLLVRNTFKPYLSTFNNNGKWYLQNNEFKTRMLNRIDAMEKQEIFQELSMCRSLADECFYYSLFGNRMQEALQMYVARFNDNIQLYSDYLQAFFTEPGNIRAFAQGLNSLQPADSYAAYSSLLCKFYTYSNNSTSGIDAEPFLRIILDSLHENTVIDFEGKNFLLAITEDTLAYLLTASSDTGDVEQALEHMRRAIACYKLSHTGELRIQYIENSINELNNSRHV